MPDENQGINAWLEKRDSERVSTKVQVKFWPIERAEADRHLESSGFKDAFGSARVPQAGTAKDTKDGFTDNISVSGLKLSGDMRLVGGKALNEGDYLYVEITLPDVPIPAHALATVVWSDADNSDPVVFHAGLFFVGINRHDVAKIARFLVLQRRAKHS